MTISEKTIQVNGLSVRYWEDGDSHGRPLLLIHGGTAEAEQSWCPALPLLGESFRVIAPDLPGFGKSQAMPNMTMQAILDWVKALLDALEIEHAVLVGNSFGGLIVRLFAAAYPQYVPAVILVNGGGVPDIPPALRFLAKIPVAFGLFGRMANSRGTIKRMIHDQTVLTEDFFKAAQAAGQPFSNFMRMMVLNPLPEQRTPQVPTLILWGADDEIATVADAKAIKQSIPGAVLTEIAECGHMPQLETQEVFSWQVSEFLAGLSRASQPKRGAGMLPNLPNV